MSIFLTCKPYYVLSCVLCPDAANDSFESKLTDDCTCSECLFLCRYAETGACSCVAWAERYMELVVFTGLQGSGKSNFYFNRFADTHLRINLDMLRTRRRENAILDASLKVGQRVVIDNTNPTTVDRAVYLQAANELLFDTVAYYFDVPYETCKERNDQRSGKKRVPEAGLKATAKNLIEPTTAEGFGTIHRVDADGVAVLDWAEDEI